MAPKMEAVSGASGGVGWIAPREKDSSSSSVLGHHASGPLTPVDASQRCGTPTCPMTPPPDAGNQPPKQSPRIVRRRSALKIDTPKPAPLSSSPPKQTPDSISVSARSSSVVAPSRDGKAGMLFSRAELRLPMRTAPLSARAHGRSSSFGGGGAGSGRGSGRWNGAFLSTGSAGGGGDSGDGSGGGSGGGSGSSSVCLARPSPSFATVREEEATKRCCFAASSCPPSTLCSLSPPRLAALDTTTRTRSRRASADGRLQMLTAPHHRGATATTTTPTAAAATTVSTTKCLGKGVTLVHGGAGGAPSPADSCGSTPAPSPESTVYPTEEEYSGGSERPVSGSRHSLLVMPSLIEMPALIDPAVGEADYLADYARGQGHGTAGRQQGTNAQDLGTGGGGGGVTFEGEALGSARSSSGRGTGSGGERRTWGRKSRGGGGVRGHTGMSVAEFADKVAALAADVAGVFGMSGRKTISPPAVPCGLQQPGVE